MKWLFGPLTALALTHALPFADSQVTFSAQDSAFSVIPTATGSVRKDGSFITVALDRFTLRLSDVYKQPERILGYRISLVKNGGGGNWDIVRSSATTAVNLPLALRQTISIPNYRIDIPIDGLTDIGGAWLVIAVDVQGEGSAGVVYAHGENWHLP